VKKRCEEAIVGRLDQVFHKVDFLFTAGFRILDQDILMALEAGYWSFIRQDLRLAKSVDMVEVGVVVPEQSVRQGLEFRPCYRFDPEGDPARSAVLGKHEVNDGRPEQIA
jgi:hypothetical protein